MVKKEAQNDSLCKLNYMEINFLVLLKRLGNRHKIAMRSAVFKECVCCAQEG